MEKTQTAAEPAADITLVPKENVKGEMKRIPLKDIIPDPDQPRKYFDQLKMDELIDSIRIDDVLQPILVRPHKGKFMIVVGERRFKACLSVQVAFKNRDTIPAMIREMSDEQVLTKQLAENLQRADVHPLDEAISFKSLFENKHRKLSIDEIAALVGKTPYFVRQRIKLTSLTKGWQEVFYKNKVHTNTALIIATFEQALQDELYKAKINKKNLDNADWLPQFWPSDFESLQRKLNKAPFDTKDATLLPTMGACTTCAFNSAVASLFPEDAKDPTCKNRNCFQSKCSRGFELELKKAKDDPGTILIYESTYQNHNSDLITKLEKEGVTLYKTGETCITNERWNYKEYKGMELKAFIINGTSAGHYTKAKVITKSKTDKSTIDKKKAEGKLTASDVTAEISRINEREKRNKQLDANKIHKEILAQLDKKKGSVLAMKHQGVIDRGIMLYLLINEVSARFGTSTPDNVKGLPPQPKGNNGYAFEYLKQLGKIDDNKVAAIIRDLCIDKWGTKTLDGEVRPEDTCTWLIAQYAGVDIKSIEKAQNAMAEKRNANAKKRIDSLRGQLKTKPAAKKSADIKKPAKKK